MGVARVHWGMIGDSWGSWASFGLVGVVGNH